MNRRSLLITLLTFTTLAVGLFGLNIGLGNEPKLGLDLRGGLSVIYSTAEAASADDLLVVRDLMRGQLEDFGISEPDVRVEGANIIVDLPGVADQAEAFEALKVSGIVTLRPVLQCQAVSIPDSSDASTSGDDSSSDAVLTDATIPSSTTPSTQPADSSDSSSALGSVGSGSLRHQPAGLRLSATATTIPATTDPASTEPEITVPDSTVPEIPVVVGPPAPIVTTPPATVPTDPDTGLPDGQDFLETQDGSEFCIVGPAGGTGSVFEKGSAKADIDPNNGQWVVGVGLRGDGEAAWNALARTCSPPSATCPTGQLAIVLDDVIQSAPVVQSPEFSGTVQISGAFEESEVRALARVLNRGAFPVAVVQERVETVSATAGQDSLNAAVIAGLIGVGILMAFMVWYYRKFSVVIIAGMVVWALAVFSLASFVSQQTNYALTLAGVTGIIVAVGITVDTYVVFFERLRDEMRHGRSLRNAAPRSFKSTWRTILAADVVSLIASIILFVLSVGSVKGFALFLGLTTVCDLLVCYFFTRPAVYLLSMTRWFSASDQPAVGAGIGASS